MSQSYGKRKTTRSKIHASSFSGDNFVTPPRAWKGELGSIFVLTIFCGDSVPIVLFLRLLDVSRLSRTPPDFFFLTASSGTGMTFVGKSVVRLDA